MWVNELKEDGKLVIKIAKGGAIVYLAGDTSADSKADNLILKCLAKRRSHKEKL